MNVKLIVDQAKLHKDMDIDIVYGRRWINEAIGVLSAKYDSACKQETTTIVCTDILEEYDLPADCRGVRRVTDSGKTPTNNFNIDLGKIQFGTPGTYTIRYLRTPKNVLTDSEEPEIHPDYHLAIALFVASKELSRVNKIDPKAPQLLGEFYEKAMDVDNRLTNMKRVSKILNSPTWG